MTSNILRMCSRVGFVAVLLCGMAAAPAQPIEVEAFTAPKSVEQVVPDYPEAQLRRGGEGLVRIDFMVDTSGRVFDPVVIDSTGSSDFHEVALEALSRTSFTPAMRNGKAIVGSSSFLYEFTLEGGTRRSSAAFANLYRLFQRALENEDQEEIESALAELEENGAANHYEHSFLNLARYNHALSYGSERNQLDYLTQALSVSVLPEDPVYLDEDLVRELRRVLLPLELRHNRFRGALATYALMEANGDEDALEFFADAIERVKELEFDETEYAIPLSLDESGSVWIDLYKHHVALAGGSGRVSEVMLRCEQHYIVFEVERDVLYDVPPEWGTCSLEVIGEPGADFFLLQN